MDQLNLHTPLCDLLGCAYPVLLTGMGGVSRADLVAAVSEAGGYGWLGMVREEPDLIRQQIQHVRAQTARPFGVNIIPGATPPELLDRQIEVLKEERVDSVCLFWGVYPDVIAALRRENIMVAYQCGDAREAESAAQAGAHMIILQGAEAGGHVKASHSWRDQIGETLRRCDVPVAVAGGIIDGRSLAGALRHGAHGAAIGTAFLMTPEANAHEYHKQRILQAGPDETVLVRDFHWNWPSDAPVRVLPNSVTRQERGNPWAAQKEVIARQEGKPVYLFSTDSPLRDCEGDMEAMALYAGTGAGALTDIKPAGERLRDIAGQARTLLDDRPETGPAMPEEASELASPPNPPCRSRVPFCAGSIRTKLIAAVF